MKKLTELAIIFVLFGISSWAQETRHEVTVQGSGFFQKQTTANGITNDPTNSGGLMAGYRFNLKNWFAVEGTMIISGIIRHSLGAVAPRSYR